MPFLAGEIVTAARLNRIQPVPYQAIASSNLTGIQTNADIPGATITLTTLTNSAVYVCHGVFDAGITGANVAILSGGLSVDGAVQTARGLLQQAAGANNDRVTAAQEWRGTLATAGSHTLKLVGTCSDADNAFRATHTVIEVTIYEVV